MKNYKSELINKILEQRGHEMSTLHYESECIETWINEEKGAYPKLTDYESEWLNYIIEKPVGEFPYETITDVTNATVDNVVPYAYKSAILKGNTKFINEYGVEQADKTIFHSCYFEQGTIGGSIGSETLKVSSTTRLRTNKPLSLEMGSYSIEVISGYEVYAKIINATNNKGIRQSEFNSSISFNITESSKEKVYIVFRKSSNAIITTDEVERIVSVSTIPELTSLSLVSVKMPVLTTSNEDGTKTNILTVNEDVTLRSNGNICDELNLLTGQLTQRIDEDGEVLSQEVVTTVNLSVIDQDGNTLSQIKPLEGTMHISTDGTPLKPRVTMEIPVEAITQNLTSFIEEE